MSAIVGPIPPYQNWPIQSQFYSPKSLSISNIQLGRTTLVTTYLNVEYVIGQEVRLLIPSEYGSYQLNNCRGLVINIPFSNQVEVTIDSTMANEFNAMGVNRSPPQILAVGDYNSGAINESGNTNNITYIPGSFINISPQ